MVIKGNPPQLRPTHLREKIVYHYLRDGRVVVQKWPRRRPSLHNPTTRAQVQVWDMALEWVKWPEPSEYAWALAATAGTAFYARDMLISSMYGNFISWPGYGWRAMLSDEEIAALTDAEAVVDAQADDA